MNRDKSDWAYRQSDYDPNEAALTINSWVPAKKYPQRREMCAWVELSYVWYFSLMWIWGRLVQIVSIVETFISLIQVFTNWWTKARIGWVELVYARIFRTCYFLAPSVSCRFYQFLSRIWLTSTRGVSRIVFLWSHFWLSSSAVKALPLQCLCPCSLEPLKPLKLNACLSS